ncbi:MAG TPA: tRNA dihydrouridine synthase DusB [Planctomycetota bacterium]|nr:tRNA dihydrouridine synthase DusB [Planctomycetota bacterium]
MNTPLPPIRRHEPIPLGPLSIWPPVVLAPMAGVTSYPFRKICRDHGAGLCVSEMISSRGILEGHDRTWQLAQFGPGERPRSIQIFGCDPAAMGESVHRLRAELDVDHIDLNFGCPVPKVTKKGMGAAAPLDAANFRSVVRSVVKAAERVPVTIKVRLGMDEERLTYREAGRVAEGEGCAYIALHGRTARQMYSGKARWGPIRELKELVRIPVLGNGDIFEAPDAFRMLEETGADGVVIGRGALGNPWLFRNLKRMFEGTGLPERPAIEELVDVVREHFRLLLVHNAAFPRLAVLLMRKLGTWYVRGLSGAVALRVAFQKIESGEDLERILETMLRLGYESGFRDPAEGTREPVVAEGTH